MERIISKSHADKRARLKRRVLRGEEKGILLLIAK